MSDSTLRGGLWLATGVATLGAIGTLVAAVALPVEPHAHAAPTPDRVAGPEAPAPAAFPPLEAYAAIWEKGAAPNAYAPPAEPDPLPVADATSIPLQLIGTAVERGRRAAIVVDSAGKVRVCAEGESIDSTTIRRVEPGRVEVVHDGGLAVLQLPTPGEPGAAAIGSMEPGANLDWEAGYP